MNVRKFPFVWTLGLALLLSLSGCNKSSDSADNKGGTAPSGTASGGASKKIKVGIVFDSGGIGDKSFNDSANAGLQKAINELGIEAKPIQSKSEADYATNIQALADQDCDLVIAIGINMQAAMQKVAPGAPETKFAIVDAVVDAPNVRSLLFSEEQGSFLAGYLAGKISKTHTIGFVGGMKLDLIEKFRCGYEAGAKTADPATVALPAKYTGDWNNVDVAKASAQVLFGGGADVVYHAAGRAGLGVLDAAKESGKYGIGVDSDQDDVAPGRVLTSMIKHVDVAVYQTIKDAIDDKFSAGQVEYDLKAGGVDISPMNHTKELMTPEIKSELDKLRAQIIDGSLKVPAKQDELDAYLKTIGSK